MMWKAAREESVGLFSANLIENVDGENYLESVWLGDELLHREEFPASRLGEADRQTYIDAVLASVVRKHQIGS